jgi:hypothetical protein
MGEIYKDSHGMDFIKPFKKLSNDKKFLVKNKIIQHETGKLNLNNLNNKRSNSFLIEYFYSSPGTFYHSIIS